MPCNDKYTTLKVTWFFCVTDLGGHGKTKKTAVNHQITVSVFSAGKAKVSMSTLRISRVEAFQKASLLRTTTADS